MAEGSLTSPAHRALLERFGEALGGEGFPVTLAPARDEIPYDTLLVELDPGVQLELSFVPRLEDQLEGHALVQCFARVPGDLAPTAVPELAALVAEINTRLPLVGFGYLTEPPMAFFRHVLLVPDAPEVATALAVQAAWMVSYLLAEFGAAVAAVAAGERTAEAGLAGSPYRSVYR